MTKKTPACLLIKRPAEANNYEVVRIKGKAARSRGLCFGLLNQGVKIFHSDFSFSAINPSAYLTPIRLPSILALATMLSRKSGVETYVCARVAGRTYGIADVHASTVFILRPKTSLISTSTGFWSHGIPVLRYTADSIWPASSVSPCSDLRFNLRPGPTKKQASLIK